jgi:hypothetical protein
VEAATSGSTVAETDLTASGLRSTYVEYVVGY